jgi:hypothetical protein
MADPGTLGAIHWWRADTVTLTSGRVSTWPDLVASADWVQTNSSYRPIVQSAYVNGQDVLDFTGSASEYLEQPDPLGMSGTTATHKAIQLFFVLKLKADPPATGNTTLHNIFTASPGSAYPWTDGSIYDATMMTGLRFTPGNPAQSLASWHTWEVLRMFGNNSITQYLGGRNRFWVSGFKLTGNENDVNHYVYGSPSQWELGHAGATAPSGSHLHGYIAEMAIFGLMGPTQRIELYDYLESRYSTALWTPTSSTVRVTQVGVEAILQVDPMSSAGVGAAALANITTNGTGTNVLTITAAGGSTVTPITTAGTGSYTPPATVGSGQSALLITTDGTGTYTPLAITGTGAATITSTSSGTGTVSGAQAYNYVMIMG